SSGSKQPWKRRSIQSRSSQRRSSTGSRRPSSKEWRPDMGVTVSWDPETEQVPARVAAWHSMHAVSEGRKDDWLALFDPAAVVEDPVGVSGFDPEGKGHRGRSAIAAFWDASIANVQRVEFGSRASS